MRGGGVVGGGGQCHQPMHPLPHAHTHKPAAAGWLGGAGWGAQEALAEVMLDPDTGRINWDRLVGLTAAGSGRPGAAAGGGGGGLDAGLLRRLRLAGARRGHVTEAGADVRALTPVVTARGSRRVTSRLRRCLPHARTSESHPRPRAACVAARVGAARLPSTHATQTCGLLKASS